MWSSDADARVLPSGDQAIRVGYFAVLSSARSAVEFDSDLDERGAASSRVQYCGDVYDSTTLVAFFTMS